MGGIFLIFVTLGALVGLVTIWRRALRRPTENFARCGQCGYRVEGLETMACPECGGDFRSVGIRTPQREFIRPVAFVLLWTILLPWPALIVAQAVFAVVPTEGRVVSRIELTSPGTALPLIELRHVLRSTVPRGSRLSVTSMTGSTAEDLTGVTSTLAPPVIAGGSEPETLGFELRPLATGGGPPIAAGPIEVGLDDGAVRAADLDAIEPWLRVLARAGTDAGADADASTGAARSEVATAADPGPAAAEFAQVVQMLAAGGPPTTLAVLRPGPGRTVAKSRAGYPSWIGWVLFGGGLAVYAAGLWLFFRIRRLRAAEAATDARTRGPGRS